MTSPGNLSSHQGGDAQPAHHAQAIVQSGPPGWRGRTLQRSRTRLMVDRAEKRTVGSLTGPLLSQVPSMSACSLHLSLTPLNQNRLRLLPGGGRLSELSFEKKKTMEKLCDSGRASRTTLLFSTSLIQKYSFEKYRLVEQNHV